MNKKRMVLCSLIAIVLSWPAIPLGFEYGGALGAGTAFIALATVLLVVLYTLFGLAHAMTNRPRPRQAYAKTLNQSLFTYVMWFHLVLGPLAFAALFSSTISASEKIFFGASLLILAGLHDLRDAAEVFDDQARNRLRYLQFRNLEYAIRGETFDWDSEEKKLMSEAALEDSLSGSGRTLVILLLAKNALWVGGGWLFSRLFVS